MSVAPLEQFNIMDIECYPNYFLVQFLNQDGEYNSFEMDNEQSHIDALDYDRLEDIIHSAPIVTFNGNSYDIPILSLAMKGADNELLKTASDHIILNNLKPWAFYRHYKLQQPSWNHIDINEVMPGVMVSLKSYGGRMHMPKMQDLPYNPDLSLTFEQQQEVKEYCKNDLQTTLEGFKRIADRVELRRSMSYQYHVDLRSKSDAQVAEAVLKAELFRLTNKVLPKPSVREKVFYYKKPDYISFKTEGLQQVLETVLRSPFTAKTNGQTEMTDELAALRINVCNGDAVYKFGIGGLHSQESEQAVVANSEFDIYDIDFTSYYPYIILVNKLYPENLGPAFLEVYQQLVERRLEAKRIAKTGETKAERDTANAEQESLKITINGTFGKLGSIYSPLYAPELMIQVTITGQLTLLMLIERLELAGVSIVSANTDGIVVKCPKDKTTFMKFVVSEFEKLTQYGTERVQYKGIYSRDVNNYVAITTDGKVKTKGTFSSGSLLKNPENDICKHAVIEYLKSGKSVAETIRECDDITKFVTVRTVKGGGFYGDMYLGKCVRWYYSKDSNHIITYRTSGNKVPRTDGSYPIMDLPSKLPEDIDYSWYERECDDLLMDIGLVTRPPVVKKTRAKKGI